MKGRALILSTAVLLLVAACTGSGDDVTGSTGVPADEFTIAMNWISPGGSPSWTGIMMAQDQGDFESAGLDIDWRYLNGSGTAVQVAAAGAAELGIAGAEAFLNARNQGLEITAIANHVQLNPTGLIVRADSGIETLADLAGHSVATSAPSPERILLEGLIPLSGVDPADVELLFVDAQAECTTMLAGDADACTGFFTVDVPNAEAQGVEVRFIPFVAPDGSLPGAVIFARNEYLAENEDVIRRFLQVVYDGYVAAEDDPEAVNELWGRLDPESEADHLARLIELSHQTMHSERSDSNGWGWMTDESWGVLIALLTDGGVIENEIDPSTIYTNELLPPDADW
jgi:NitT/TauT family transport system substrate-binding protein